MPDPVTDDWRRRLAQLIALEECERKQVAHELHSDIGQDLTAALLTLQFFAESGLPAEEIEGVCEAVRTALERVRALSMRLRPPLLDEIGLQAALQSCLLPMAASRGFALEISALNLPAELPAEIGTSAFRALQAMALSASPGEALTVRLAFEPRHLMLRLESSADNSAAATALNARLLGAGAAQVDRADGRWWVLAAADATAPTASS